MMTNLSEDIQCAGSDTRPPMLDRTDFESWQQRIRLYCVGNDNGVNILKLIGEGPFKMGKFRETLVTGVEGSELTKDERESQLYDEFKHFRQNKGETIHEYYVMFTKLINDMRNIKMTMPKMQLNSKTTGQGVCWEVIEGRRGVVEYGGVEQKHGRMELRVVAGIWKSEQLLMWCGCRKDFNMKFYNSLEDESIDNAFARFNTTITSLKALDEDYSSKNYVRKFFRALHPQWRAKVTAIEESKDLTSLSLDELIGNLKVHEITIKKDSEIVKEKVERKSLALKAKKESSDEECLTSDSEDEEYAMSVRDFKKFFKRRECPKPPKDKNQRAFVRGSWSDSGEEDDEKVKNKTCLVAQASSDVCSESFYFSDENSSIDDLALDNEYDKLCKISLKIITKNKRLKANRNSLEKEISILKEKVPRLNKNKEIDLGCVECHMLKIENEKLKEEALKLTKFEKSTHCLNEMLNNQKPSGKKLGLGYNSFEASSSGTKEIKFVKAQIKVSSDGGPINMGGPLNV
nr:hypothetical protein [Tanacetum cinerariifolium]